MDHKLPGCVCVLFLGWCPHRNTKTGGGLVTVAAWVLTLRRGFIEPNPKYSLCIKILRQRLPDLQLCRTDFDCEELPFLYGSEQYISSLLLYLSLSLILQHMLMMIPTLFKRKPDTCDVLKTKKSFEKSFNCFKVIPPTITLSLNEKKIHEANINNFFTRNAFFLFG